MLTLAHNFETGFFQGTDSPQMINARDLGHSLNKDFDFANVSPVQRFVHCGQILLNGVTNILDGFLLGLPLRPTARESRTVNSITLVRFLQNDGVAQTHQLNLSFPTWFFNEVSDKNLVVYDISTKVPSTVDW
jgi:hypothetical protein